MKEILSDMCFRPNTQALRLQHVNLYCMRHVGVKVLLLDADNTICPWNCHDIDAEVVNWVQTAKDAGFAVLVASNNNLERLMPLTEKLGIGAIAKAGKPLPFKIKKAIKGLGFTPKQCAMIGDQVLTDVLAGNLAGMHTVLLQPIDLSAEFKMTVFNRKVEKVVKKLWKIW